MHYKKYVIAAVMVIGVTVFWAVARDWVQDPLRLDNVWHVAIPAMVLLVAGALMGLGYALLDRSSERWYATGGAAGMFPVILGFSAPILSGMVATFLALWWADHTITQHLRDRQTIRIRHVIAGGISWVMVALYIACSFAYYQTPLNRSAASQAGLEQYVRDTAEKTYEGVLKSELSQLPPTERARVLAKSTDSILSLTKQYVGPFAKYFPPLLAVAFFLVLLGLNFILAEISIWLALGIFSILKASGFIRMEKKQVEADVLTL